MIVTGTYPKPEHPVIVDLRTALGDAIDAQQVAIVRAHLDAVESPTVHMLDPYGRGDVSVCGEPGPVAWLSTGRVDCLACLDAHERAWVRG